MNDIEERAREWCNGIINRLDTSDLERGYIQGATEQKSIDIDKACEWLENEFCHYDEIDGCRFVDKFRKAIEGISGNNEGIPSNLKALKETMNAFIAFCNNIINGMYVSVVDAAKEQLEYLENDSFKSGKKLQELIWHKTSEELPKEGIEVIGYRKDWIDEDFNPNGTRTCFYNEGQWTSAFWWDYQDTYMTINEDVIQSNPSFYKNHIGRTNPTHWMEIPGIKED